MPPAARATDMHVCPMVTGIVPHVGGPILPPCEPTVLIGFLPAARVTDMLTCVGPPDIIVMGSPTVLIGGLMAARLGDPTAHGGVIILGCFTVMIGEAGVGSPVVGSSSLPPGPGQPAGKESGSSPPPANKENPQKTDATGKKYESKPSLNDVLNDPHVDSELKKAWKESNPDAPEVPAGKPGSTKKEQGGWIIWNKKTGKLEVLRVAAGDRAGLGPIVGTRPTDNKDQEVVSWFHTHPNTAKEGYQHGPSPGDIAWQKSEAKVPGIIETHEGRKTIPNP